MSVKTQELGRYAGADLQERGILNGAWVRRTGLESTALFGRYSSERPCVHRRS